MLSPAQTAVSNNIVVKIPMIREGVKAINRCNQNGIRTNCTLVFSAAQAILAAFYGTA